MDVESNLRAQLLEVSIRNCVLTQQLDFALRTVNMLDDSRHAMFDHCKAMATAQEKLFTNVKEMRDDVAEAKQLERIHALASPERDRLIDLRNDVIEELNTFRSEMRTAAHG